jgi:peptidoglycan/LPS O-acetylase OafA/YrhL
MVFNCRAIVFCPLQLTPDRTYYATDTRADGLLFGCALAVFGNPVIDGSPKYERLLKYLFVPVALGAMVFSVVYRPEFFRETFRYTLQGLALIPLFIAAISYPDWFLFKPLNSRVAKFFGKISCSFYLLHYTVIESLNAVFTVFSKFVAGLLAMAVATLLAYLIGLWIERPMLKYRR